MASIMESVDGLLSALPVNSVLRERVLFLKDQIQALESSNAELKDHVAELKEDVRGLKAELASAKEETAALAKQLADAKAELEKANGRPRLQMRFGRG